MFGSPHTSTRHFRYLNASLSMGEISLHCLKLSWCWSLVSGRDLGRRRSTLQRWGSHGLKPYLVQGSPGALGGCSLVCSFSRACWGASRWFHAEAFPGVLEVGVQVPGLISTCAAPTSAVGHLRMTGCQEALSMPVSGCFDLLKRG